MWAHQVHPEIKPYKDIVSPSNIALNTDEVAHDEEMRKPKQSKHNLKHLKQSKPKTVKTLRRVHSATKRKQAIPAALKSALWLAYNGKCFEAKCHVTWCHTMINVFNFEAGHDIPESKGGPTTLDNLRPICALCNKSMGNTYTIAEFSSKFSRKTVDKPKKYRSSIFRSLAHAFTCWMPSKQDL